MPFAKDNQRPLPPVPYVGEGNADPSDGSHRNLTPASKAGLVWAAVGGALAPVGEVLSCPLVAYGVVVASWGQGLRELVGGIAIALAAAACVTALVAPASLVASLIACAAACAVAGVVSRRASTTPALCLIVAVAAILELGIDALLASLEGTSLPALVTQVSAALASTMGSSLNLEGRASLIAARDTLKLYWPMLYMAQALAVSLLGLWGARIGARTMGDARRPGAFLRLSVPLWVTIAFIVGAGLAIAGNLTQGFPEIVRVAGLNICAAARVGLALQGLAVALWYARKVGFGPFMRALLVILAAWLEASYVVMSIIGAIDAFANLRSLGGGTASEGSGQVS